MRKKRGELEEQGGELEKIQQHFGYDESSLQTKGAGLLHGREHLLMKHGEGRVGREIQAVKAGVSPIHTNICAQMYKHFQYKLK